MSDTKRKVCVLGLGYIGLPTASLLGTKGYQVVGVDVSADVVETINGGRIHIVEPDLDILVKSAVQSGNLRASLAPEEADVFIIAVPTPLRDGHAPDLTYVEMAARSIAPVVKAGNLVILESTSPVGTTQNLVARILTEAGHTVGRDVFVAHCPERVLPGRILTELVENDRIVGGVDEASAEKAAAFMAEFVRGEVITTDAATAEMTKLVENAFRDVNIAFANELSIIAEKASVNTWELIRLANRHPRVNILNPGPGVGGHCIAVDPWFIVAAFPEDARLMRTAREVNDAKPDWVVDHVKAKAEKFKRPVIACLGLAFKADVDDLRESPALAIVRRLRDEAVGELLVCEPNLRQHPEFALTAMEDAVAAADIVLLLVDHRPFRRLKPAQLKEKVLIDTRGLFG
jgi:UDP-N-acetyl-D-mannosaminuronic acid dehydrogenase